MTLRKMLVLALLVGGLVGIAPPARAQETDLLLHDPSALLKRGDTYWVFGTGRGIASFSSTDRVHWTFRGEVLPQSLAWVKDVVPGNTNNHLWAPDVVRVGGTYYLYYSVSTFGSNVSAIGLATSRTLEPGSWTDEGVVIRSQRSDNFNAIDPAALRTPDGKLYLSFGSFWSGIRMVELDPTTGKRLAPDAAPLALAAHPQDRANAIEAPFIHYRDGYYYLFVNWDVCCRGPRSTYNIRVGRSRSVTGPYRDKTGMDLLRGGGTPLLDSRPDKGDGKPFDAKVGPGHAGILNDQGVDRFSFHYEYVRDNNGRSTLEIGTVAWGKTGWPRIVLETPRQPAPATPAPVKGR